MKGVSTNRLWTYLGIACGACAVLAACASGSHGAPPDGPDPTAQTITIHLQSTKNLALITLPWGRDARTKRIDGGDTITSLYAEGITP
jgi:hypothetical protein